MSLLISIADLDSSMTYYSNNEPEVYFYHGDHLGSASWKKERFGKPFASERAEEARSGIPHTTSKNVQHLQYKPFGEPYIDQRVGGYQERYTFTGKERDEETGYGYFGARYMDHELMTSFISVDRYADKYPFISPYAYCAWNPLRLIDPNGDSIAVLIAEKAVFGNGHMAILVQTDNGEWQLWSKNGEGKSLSEDKSASNNDKPYGRTFQSVQDFLDDHKANSEGHNGSAEPYYTEAYVMPTTKKQDKAIREKMATFMSSYHLLSDNCADAVKKSLKAAGVTTEIDPMQRMSNTAKAVAYSSPGFLLTRHMTEDVIPVTIYRNIKEANPDGTVCKPRRKE